MAQDKQLMALVEDVMGEIVSIARSRNIALPDDIVARSLGKAANFPYETKTSYQRDMEKGGKNEGDLFGGTIIEMGRALGVSTPVAERIYTAISGDTT